MDLSWLGDTGAEMPRNVKELIDKRKQRENSLTILYKKLVIEIAILGKVSKKTSKEMRATVEGATYEISVADGFIHFFTERLGSHIRCKVHLKSVDEPDAVSIATAFFVTNDVVPIVRLPAIDLKNLPKIDSVLDMKVDIAFEPTGVSVEFSGKSAGSGSATWAEIERNDTKMKAVMTLISTLKNLETTFPRCHQMMQEGE